MIDEANAALPKGTVMKTEVDVKPATKTKRNTKAAPVSDKTVKASTSDNSKIEKTESGLVIKHH